MPQIDTDNLLPAHSIRIAMCADPECGKLHILLLDEYHKPFAFGPIESLEDHIEELKRWAYIAATRRPDVRNAP